MAEEFPQTASENGTESGYRRLSRITLVVMIYSVIGAQALLLLAALVESSSNRLISIFLLYPMFVCMLAFFLGVLVQIVLVVFGAMRLTLRSLLGSALTLGFGVTCIVSGVPLMFLGLAALSGLLTFWVYHFFKAIREQDRRDGIV